jgi:adenosine kinase
MTRSGILGLGNPLLDEQTFVDTAFLEKYLLNPNDAILAEGASHQALFAEIPKRSDVEYVAGGSAQNTIRAAQWCLGANRAGRTAYFGSVGVDEAAETMRRCCEAAGVAPKYLTLENEETGKCAVLISDGGKHRSLVAKLAAAEKFQAPFLKKHTADLVEKFEIFYNEGFFVTVSPEAIDHLALMAKEHGGVYATNISAEFVVSVPEFREVFLKNLPNTDFLFGNAAEFLALARGLEIPTEDLKAVAKFIAESDKTGNPQRPRTVVITQGHETTILAVTGETVREVPVVEVKPELIVDVNGAGDAYVGGFLAALSEGKDVLECCRIGAECAAIVIQRVGCTFPGTTNCLSL